MSEFLKRVSVGAVLLCATFTSSGGAEIRFVAEKSKNRVSDWAHVEIAGEIVQGDVQKLRKALEEATTRAIETYAPIVIINSQGGSVSVSLEMGKVLRDYHANTVVDGNGTCSSSCIFVFAGGVMRDLFSNGRFGLHRPRFDYEQFSNLPEDQARAAYETLSSACADFMRRMGISERVFSEMLKVPSQEIRFVGREYAEKYNLVGTDPGWEEWVRARDIHDWGEARIKARDRLLDCYKRGGNDVECKGRYERELREINQLNGKQ